MTASHWLNEQLTASFTVSVMLAVLLHAVVLLGIGFVIDSDPLADAADTLDVVLVNLRSETAPEEVDFLAEANQQGGAEEDRPERPAQELASILPGAGDGPAPLNSEAARAEPTPDVREQVRVPDESEAPVAEQTLIEQPDIPALTTAELMRQRMQVAQLQARLQRDQDAQTRFKRRRFIAANTREYEFASYMQAWVSKVERVGNLNYPQEVRRRGLVGDLLLTVGINQDGSVESIDIRRSSGMPELDEAALRIVHMAAPLAPLPQNIASKVDVLHITRTWKFSNSQKFQ